MDLHQLKTRYNSLKKEILVKSREKRDIQTRILKYVLSRYDTVYVVYKYRTSLDCSYVYNCFLEQDEVDAFISEKSHGDSDTYFIVPERIRDIFDGSPWQKNRKIKMIKIIRYLMRNKVSTRECQELESSFSSITL